jgi:rfaE bifunctional protein nucleotidyltransferase chain/domain
MDEASKALVSHKIKSAEEIAALIGPPPRAKKVVMCHGTFDIVHPGHVRHLLYAKSKGDMLVASLTADAHITKANFRPFVPQELRAFNLAALEVVDYVVIDRMPTPVENIKIIRPDYFAKGYEYVKGGLPPRTVDEKTAVETYGGEILFTPGDIVYSSSSIIESEPPAIATEKLLSLLQAEK